MDKLRPPSRASLDNMTKKELADYLWSEIQAKIEDEESRDDALAQDLEWFKADGGKGKCFWQCDKCGKTHRAVCPELEAALASLPAQEKLREHEEALFQAANTAAINLSTSMNLREHPDSCECYGCGLNRAVVDFALARAKETVRPIVERELRAERWPVPGLNAAVAGIESAPQKLRGTSGARVTEASACLLLDVDEFAEQIIATYGRATDPETDDKSLWNQHVKGLARLIRNWVSVKEK